MALTLDGTAGITASGNITGNYILGNGSQLSGIITSVSSLSNGSSNVAVASSGGNVTVGVGGTPSVAVFSTAGANVAGTLGVTGNITGGNLSGTSIVGTLTTAAQTNITSVGTLGTLSVTGNANTGNLGATTVAATNLTGTLTTAAQTNITSVGTLGSLSVTGNANTGNLGATTVVATNLTGTLTTAAQPNITSVGTLGSLSVTGNANVGNMGTNGNITASYFFGNGSQLTGIDATSIQNGTSNVKVTSSGGNVTTSVGGQANVLIVTSTGANITGTLNNGTGNANLGNLGVTNVVATNLTGALQTASQTNITSVGTLGTLSVTGNANVGNLGATTVVATNLTGTLTTAAQPNVTSLGTLTGLSITGDITQTGNINITGNINATGNLNYQNVTDLVVGDPLIYLGANNVANLDDLGFVANWDDGLYQHGGFVRNHLNGVWGVFGNVVAEPTTVIDWGNAVYQPFRSGSATFAGANINGALSGATTINASGNITGGNLNTAGNVVASGYLFGNGSQLTGIDATSIQNGSANVRTFLNGNVTTSAAGTANVLVITSTGANITGTLNATGNANVGNIGGTNAVFTNLTGTLQTAAQPNITSLGTLTSLASSGSITGRGGLFLGNTSTGNTIWSVQDQSGTIVQEYGRTDGVASSPAFDFHSGATATDYDARIQATGGTGVTGQGNLSLQAANFNITATTIVTGNISGGNLLTSGNIVDTGALSIITAASGNVNLAPNGTNVLVATTTGANITGTLNVTGDVTFGGNLIDTGALTVSTSSNGNITLSPDGTGVVIINKNLINGQANGVGNIGSATTYFNTVFAKATSAQYADLAEKYTADAEYAPGTVLHFGGSAEVTLCNIDMCSRVAGVVTTDPAYLMNSHLESAHTAAIALQGRVPTKVMGTTRKGDMMVSTGNGYARAEANPKIGTVIGKALENFDGDIGTIEVAVGRI